MIPDTKLIITGIRQHLMGLSDELDGTTQRLLDLSFPNKKEQWYYRKKEIEKALALFEQQQATYIALVRKYIEAKDVTNDYD